MKLSKSSNIATSIVFTTALLAACGGGGGGDATSTTETTPTPTSSGSPATSSSGVPSPTPTPPGAPVPTPTPGVTISPTPSSPPAVGVISSRYSSALPLGYAGSATECVRDNVTGLVWEGKVGNNLFGSLYEKGAVFTNFTSTSRLENAGPLAGGDVSWTYPNQGEIDSTAEFVGAAGHPYGWWTYTLDASYFMGNASAYLNRVNISNYCGASNWRIPTQAELMTLINNNFEPKIDPTWFPNTARGNYWTVEDLQDDWNSYRNVHFGSAMSFTQDAYIFDFKGVGNTHRSKHHHLRLVRN